MLKLCLANQCKTNCKLGMNSDFFTRGYLLFINILYIVEGLS
jgi:hypothetical protein